MKRLMSVLAVVGVCVSGVLAAEAQAIIKPARNGEVEVGGSFIKPDAGAKSADFYVNAYAPLVGHLYVSPEFRLHYSGLQEGYGFGAAAEYNFGKSKRVQPYVKLDGVRWSGGYERLVKYQASGSAGVKLGTDRLYIRLGYEYTREFGSGHDDVNGAQVGIGIRL
jgi:hypothetical protein